MKYALKRVYKNGRNDPANKKSKYDDWDPKYEWVENPRNGKWKKVKKDLSYVPKHDLAIYNKVRSRAVLLDSCFNIGIGRAGLSSVIGFIPGVGDVSDVVLAYYIYHLCKQVEGGLSTREKSKMKQNIVLDGFIGLVPFLGDIADTAFKANLRNLKILEKHLRDKYEPFDDDNDDDYKKSTKPTRRNTGKSERYDYNKADRRSDSSWHDDELEDAPRRNRRRDREDEYYREPRRDARHSSRHQRY